jgi:hypothetical protein
MSEFCNVVQTCVQLVPLAVGFEEGQLSFAMLAQTSAQEAVLVGGQPEGRKAKRIGMKRRFIATHISDLADPSVLDARPALGNHA